MSMISAATCLDRQRIAEFLGGRSSDEEAQWISHHADECESCAKLLAQLIDESDSALRLIDGFDEHLESEAAYCELRGRLLGGATPAWTIPPLPMTLGQYELLEPLGQGGMGRVFKARHRHLKQLMAVKLLAPERLNDQEAVNRFLVEMEAVGRLRHPHLVRATDAARIDGMYFLVMDYEAGIDLGELLRRVPRIDVADACEIIRQAAEGLQFAHENGLIHCDIKPSNLFLTEQGIIKVLDLGLARIGTDRSNSLSKSVAGTIDYMAPEQWIAGGAVDIRADIYGLGCTLHKLLTGHAPYESPGATLEDRRRSHRAAAIPSLSAIRTDVPAGLDAVQQRLLAKRREQRFAKPRDVAEALAPFSKGSRLPRLAKRAAPNLGDTVRMGDATNTSLSSRLLAPLRSKRRVFVALGLLLCLAAIIGVGLAIATHRDSDQILKPDVAAIAALPRVDLYGDPLPPGAIARLGTLRFRYRDIFSAAAFSPDGQFVVGAGNGGILVMWECASGKLVQEFSSYHQVQQLTFSGDGTTLATLDDDHAIRLWSRGNDRAKRLIPVFRRADRDVAWNESIDGLAISRTARYVMLVVRDKSLRLWKTESSDDDAPIFEEAVAPGDSIHLFSPDEQSLILASKSKPVIRVMDILTSREIRRIDAGTAALTACAISPDGKLLVSTGQDRKIRGWELATGKPIWEIDAPEGKDALSAVAFMPDGKSFVTSAGIGASLYRRWDAATGRALGSIEAKPQKDTLAISGNLDKWDPLESTCRHASLSIL